MIKNFISIEGGEGSGKSTVSQLLLKKLLAENIDTLVSREPGGVKASEEIRKVLWENEVDEKTEILLFAAARNEHLTKKILPALSNGQLVICDRFIDSSLVYQGFAVSGGFEEVLRLNEYVVGKNFPEFTYYLRIDPKIALSRLNGEEREINRFDERELSFHQRVFEGYEILAHANPERIVVIDASKSVDEVVEDIFNHIMRTR